MSICRRCWRECRPAPSLNQLSAASMTAFMTSRRRHRLVAVACNRLPWHEPKCRQSRLALLPRHGVRRSPRDARAAGDERDCPRFHRCLLASTAHCVLVACVPSRLARQMSDEVDRTHAQAPRRIGEGADVVRCPTDREDVAQLEERHQVVQAGFAASCNCLAGMFSAIGLPSRSRR